MRDAEPIVAQGEPPPCVGARARDGEPRPYPGKRSASSICARSFSHEDAMSFRPSPPAPTLRPFAARRSGFGSPPDLGRLMSLIVAPGVPKRRASGGSASALILTAPSRRARARTRQTARRTAQAPPGASEQVRIAARRRSGRSAIGLDQPRRTASAADDGRRRKVTTKPARRLRIAGPGPSQRQSPARPSRGASCKLANEPARRLGLIEARSSWVRGRDQRRVTIWVVSRSPTSGMRGGPVGARRRPNLLQFFLACSIPTMRAI